MREILTDLVKQTATLFETIKITGSDTETKVTAVDKDKTIFLLAKFAGPVIEFDGEFGVSNLSLLDGLLKHATYRTDDSKLEVVRKQRKNGTDMVDHFRFEDDTGNGSTFRTMNPELVPEQVSFKEIPWDVTIVPQKAKISEFRDLAALFRTAVVKTFDVRTNNNGGLIFGLGMSDKDSHRSEMEFASDVEGALIVPESSGPLKFDTGHFLGVMTVAGTSPMEISVFHKGLLRVSVQTTQATYHYYLTKRV